MKCPAITTVITTKVFNAMLRDAQELQDAGGQQDRFDFSSIIGSLEHKYGPWLKIPFDIRMTIKETDINTAVAQQCSTSPKGIILVSMIIH